MTGRRGCKNVTESVKFAIVSMARAGMRQCDIANQFNLAKSTVSQIIRKSKTGQVQLKKRRGPKFKLNAAAIRILQRILLKNNKKPLFVTVAELKVNYGYNLTVKTVRRYVYKCGIRNYAAVSKPYLLPRHIEARRRWANMH